MAEESEKLKSLRAELKALQRLRADLVAYRDKLESGEMDNVSFAHKGPFNPPRKKDEARPGTSPSGRGLEQLTLGFSFAQKKAPPPPPPKETHPPLEEWTVENPHDDHLWIAHLHWMLENYPQRTWRMFQQNKLKDYLDQRVALVTVKEALLTERGVDPNLAAETIRGQLIYPDNGPAMTRDVPPKELPEEKFREIMEWAQQDFPYYEVKITL